MSDKAAQERRRKAGRCKNCGKRDPKEGCVTCHHCLDEKSKTIRDLRVSRIERGACPYCGKRRPRKGRKMCEACGERQKRYNRKAWRTCGPRAQKELRERRFQEGFCKNCGRRRPKAGCKRCGECLRQNAKRDHWRIIERKSRGLCTGCGINPPAPGRSGCPDCAARWRAKAERAKAKRS